MQKAIAGLFLILLGIICFQTSFAESVSGRVSLTDKEIIERLTRLEEGQKALNRRIDDVNQRIDDVSTNVSRRIDDLQAPMHWGFGILFAMILGLFGYLVWDRRTALQPIMEKTRSLEKLLDALREYARSDPKLAEVLRSFGLLGH